EFSSKQAAQSDYAREDRDQRLCDLGGLVLQWVEGVHFVPPSICESTACALASPLAASRFTRPTAHSTFLSASRSTWSSWTRPSMFSTIPARVSTGFSSLRYFDRDGYF